MKPEFVVVAASNGSPPKALVAGYDRILATTSLQVGAGNRRLDTPTWGQVILQSPHNTSLLN